MAAHIKLFFKYHIKFPYKILLSQVSYQFERAFNWDGIGFVLEEELSGDVCNPIGWRRFKVCILELVSEGK